MIPRWDDDDKQNAKMCKLNLTTLREVSPKVNLGGWTEKARQVRAISIEVSGKAYLFLTEAKEHNT